MRVPVQLGGHTYQSRTGLVTAQRCVNMYLEPSPAGAKSQSALLCTPGLSQWASVGDGPIRGMHRMGSALYVVSGPMLYAVDRAGMATLLGRVGSTGHVRMIDNGTHVAVATNDKMFAANSYELIELPESGICGVAYQDGYGIFAQRGGEKFWLSGIDDMTTIGGLDFSSADVFADRIVGCISNHRELWLFGESTIEGWYNSGAAAFPFERAGGAFLEIGCISGDAIAKAQRSVMWLGDDLYVYQAQGYQAQKISTPGIDTLIAASSDHSTARAFVVSHSGHTFYVLTLADLTIVYDLATGLWHERRSEDMERWRAGCHAEAFGLQLVGSVDSGDVYQLDDSVYSEAGSDLVRSVVSPPVSAERRRATMGSFELDLDVGHGLATGQGSDPHAILDWSDDGGATWSNRITASIGRIGERQAVARWTRLGQFRERMMRVTISDPVRCHIVGAYASIDVGSA